LPRPAPPPCCCCCCCSRWGCQWDTPCSYANGTRSCAPGIQLYGQAQRSIHAQDPDVAIMFNGLVRTGGLDRVDWRGGGSWTGLEDWHGGLLRVGPGGRCQAGCVCPPSPYHLDTRGPSQLSPVSDFWCLQGQAGIDQAKFSCATGFYPGSAGPSPVNPGSNPRGPSSHLLLLHISTTGSLNGSLLPIHCSSPPPSLLQATTGARA